MINDELPQKPVSLTVAQAFEQAITYHQAGRLQDAERLYRAILQAQPNHPDTNHNLGVLAVQVGQHKGGLPYLKAALAINPAHGQYALSYAEALLATGQAKEALNIVQNAVQRGLNTPAALALLQKAETATRSELPAAGSGKLDGTSQPQTKTGIASPVQLPNTTKNTIKYDKRHKNRHKISPLPKSLLQSERNELVALFNTGQYPELESRARLLVDQYPDSGFAWKALGTSLQVQGKEALPALQKATALLPDDAGVYSNLGAALRGIGELDNAMTNYRRALEIKPDFADAHNNLGAALQDLGQFDGAVASYRRALEIKPDFADAYSNLGAALRGIGELDNAMTNYQRALEIKPDFADAHNNLGAALQDLGQLDPAEASYRRALEIKPDYVDALNNFALLLNAQGKPLPALNAIRRSLQIKETGEAKSIFVDCVKRLHITQDDSDIRIYMLRALTEAWGRPSDMARAGIELVKLDSGIGGCVVRAAAAWPLRLSAQDLFGSNGILSLGADPLLCALLESQRICDIGMERFLTMARYAMLETTIGMRASDAAGLGAALNFYSALARQCFINEYVFTYTAEEIQKAGELRDSIAAALEAKTQVPVLWLVAIAAYFPLCRIPDAACLLDTQWPEPVTAVLVQQVREPAEELQLRTTIPRLTNIEDEVSLLVQNQYEANPYPRWIKVASGNKPRAVDVALHQTLPLASFQPLGKHDNLDVLIAGCGTGQHSIGTAQRFRGAHVLAVDLSMSSLCYAKRKTRELGLTSIEYAQADLLQLGSLGRSFDVIESVGVLHHLADPWAGWQVLLSLLRSGGFMKLGLYSEVARRNVFRLRNFIAEQGYGSTADEIRRCRQDLMGLDKSTGFGSTLSSADFFSISTCRDLLFHVQEHRMTLPMIDAFLRENHLTFLGFEMDAAILQTYKRRFPDDRAATDLGQWQIFENEHPDIFFGMYQFWIQK